MLDRVLLRQKGRAAYRQVFSRPGADLVLADLAIFCHATETTHVLNDPTGSAQLEGRRQVWLRIQKMLRASDDEMRARIARGLQRELGSV